MARNDDAPYRPPVSEVRSVFGEQSPGFGLPEQVGGSQSSHSNLDQSANSFNRSPKISATVQTNPLSSNMGTNPMASLPMSIIAASGAGGGGGGPYGPNLAGSGGLNSSYVSREGNRTPKQVVHNYLNGPPGRGHFSPVPVPKVMENSTDLAFLRNSLEQDAKRVAVINERLVFLEDQNRTFRELCWDKIGHLEKEALNLKEQVLEKLASMEQGQRVQLQEHAYQVTALSGKVDDFASDESTQERVQKALLRELGELKIVENIQNLSGSLKATSVKLEDKIANQGEHWEQMLHENLKNAKDEISQLISMKLQEFLVANVVPLQKEHQKSEADRALKEKDLDHLLQSLDQTVDRNRKETVEALAETRRSAFDGLRVCEKESRDMGKELCDKLSELQSDHSTRLQAQLDQINFTRDEKLPSEITSLRTDFIDRFDTYQKDFESKMFNLLATREKEEAAVLPHQNQASIQQLTQTVYQNAEVLEQVKFQVLDSAKAFGSLKQQLSSEILLNTGESEQLKSQVEKMRKWFMELDESFRDQAGHWRDVEGKLEKYQADKLQATTSSSGAMMAGSGGLGGVDSVTLDMKMNELRRDIDRRLDTQERRHGEVMLKLGDLNKFTETMSPVSRQKKNAVSSSITRTSVDAGGLKTTRRSLSSAVGNLSQQSAEWAQLVAATRNSEVEGTLPLSKKEFRAVVEQLENELRVLAEATEQELDLVRTEAFEYIERTVDQMSQDFMTELVGEDGGTTAGRGSSSSSSSGGRRSSGGVLATRTSGTHSRPSNGTTSSLRNMLLDSFLDDPALADHVRTLFETRIQQQVPSRQDLVELQVDVARQIRDVSQQSSRDIKDQIAVGVQNQLDLRGGAASSQQQVVNMQRAVADLERDVSNNRGAVEGLRAEVNKAVEETRKECASQVRSVERDLELAEARTREADMELALKQERLEKMMLQERSSAGVISAAYAAAERRGRGV
ncbi:unnamed protein product [Amoebophrya sp. A25]|nr:unnamed protein product [Amoebophrya sp. A25]|eukprot:GSA25T00008643001.1